jgi:hypothetical protein
MQKFAKIFITLSASELDRFLFVAADPNADVEAQMAALKAELAKTQAEAAAHAAKAAQHELDIQQQAAAHQQQLDAHKAETAAIQSQANAHMETAQMLGSIAMTGGAMPSISEHLKVIPGAEHVTGVVTDQLKSVGGDAFKGVQSFGEFQAKALNAGVEINPTKILSGISSLLPSFSDDSTATPAPIYSGVTSYPGQTAQLYVAEESGFSITESATNGLKSVVSMAASAPSTLKQAAKLHNDVKNMNVEKLRLDHSVVGNIIGDEEAKGLNDAFHHERKVIQEQGVKGVMKQVRENVFDPQAMPLEDYAKGIKDTFAGFGINFDQSKIDNGIAAFRNIDVDSIAERAKDKVLEGGYVQRAAEAAKAKAWATGANLVESTKTGASSFWDKVTGKNAPSKKNLRRELHAHRHNMLANRFRRFAHEPWHLMIMHLIMLVMMFCVMLVMYKKYRVMLKKRKRGQQMV